MIALVTSGLAVLLVLLREFFDWRRRKREAEDRKKALLELENAILGQVLSRIQSSSKQENSKAVEVEDRLDELLRPKP